MRKEVPVRCGGPPHLVLSGCVRASLSPRQGGVALFRPPIPGGLPFCPAHGRSRVMADYLWRGKINLACPILLPGGTGRTLPHCVRARSRSILRPASGTNLGILAFAHRYLLGRGLRAFGRNGSIPRSMPPPAVALEQNCLDRRDFEPSCSVCNPLQMTRTSSSHLPRLTMPH